MRSSQHPLNADLVSEVSIVDAVSAKAKQPKLLGKVATAGTYLRKLSEHSTLRLETLDESHGGIGFVASNITKNAFQIVN